MALQATVQEIRPTASAAAAAADPDTARRQFSLGGTGCPKTTGAGSSPTAPRPSRYASQKRRDWQMFTRYLGARRPPVQPRARARFLALPRNSASARGAKRGAASTRSLAASRAAFAEHHGAHGSGTAQESDGASANPFAARDVTMYLHDVCDVQSRARGISYNRKKMKKQNKQQDGADCSS